MPSLPGGWSAVGADYDLAVASGAGAGGVGEGFLPLIEAVAGGHLGAQATVGGHQGDFILHPYRCTYSRVYSSWLVHKHV